jgi:hypothetical protein
VIAIGKTAQAEPTEAKRGESSAEDRLWSELEGIPIGPFKLDLGGGLRLRGELLDNFDIKTYGNDSRDEILLERLRLELALHFLDGFRLFVQAQDARELGCDFSNADFPSGSPYNNSFDLRQAFLEWTRIADTPLGFKMGRQ